MSYTYESKENVPRGLWLGNVLARCRRHADSRDVMPICRLGRRRRTFSLALFVVLRFLKALLPPEGVSRK